MYLFTFSQDTGKLGIYKSDLDDSTVVFLIASDTDSSFFVTVNESGKIWIRRVTIIHWDRYEIIISPHCNQTVSPELSANVQSRVVDCGPYINRRYVWSKDYTELVLYQDKNKTKSRFKLNLPNKTFESENEVRKYFETNKI